MADFKAVVKESNKELTAREKIMIKDTGNAVKLDDAIAPGEKLVIEPDFYAILQVHNEKSDTKDYEQYMIVDKAGTKFYTGSPSFWRSFIDIFEEMGDEEYSIEVYKMESKNYKGKYFLTCSIV